MWKSEMEFLLHLLGVMKNLRIFEKKNKKTKILIIFTLTELFKNEGNFFISNEDSPGKYIVRIPEIHFFFE